MSKLTKGDVIKQLKKDLSEQYFYEIFHRRDSTVITIWGIKNENVKR